MTLKLGLASYLIKTPSACYLQTVVYGERHFLAEVQGICRIVTSDRNRFAIDETIDRKRCAQILDFIKNLLLDNLLLVDIYNRAKKLHIDTEVRRVIFIIETKHEKDTNALDNVRTLLGNRTRDFVTAVDEKNIIVVKELEPNDGHAELEKIAENMYTLLKEDGEEDILIAYGTVVGDIKEVSKSYKEAKLALDVGKIFFSERSVIAYSALGIGRLIYQLPIPLCKMFIREIFEGKSPDDFDEETLITINKFFENNLNVSETSRQLYIHRNTLVYRLDKLQKSTGLDLRVFEDAITFKIALMVVKYMKYMESLEY